MPTTPTRTRLCAQQAEYQAEQEYLKTLELMSKEDQEKQRQRQVGRCGNGVREARP